MKIFLVTFLCLLGSMRCLSQPGVYEDSLMVYQQKYVASHEVVKDRLKSNIHFFKINPKYHITANFEKLFDTTGFVMKTSGLKSQIYLRYGKLNFTIDGRKCELTVYQSAQLMLTQEYRNYLFIPFTDLTSGEKSYGGGRYLDLLIEVIKNDSVEIDFNKAYNPYCAYANGYNCPIPPAENDLPVAIEAGEMNFEKAH